LRASRHYQLKQGFAAERLLCRRADPAGTPATFPVTWSKTFRLIRPDAGRRPARHVRATIAAQSTTPPTKSMA